jgi:hypothetical protein
LAGFGFVGDRLANPVARIFKRIASGSSSPPMESGKLPIRIIQKRSLLAPDDADF